MLRRFEKLLNRIASPLTVWQTLAQWVPIVSVGAITGWLASGADWLDQFGPLGWWAAILVGAAFATIVVMGVSWARYKWITAIAIEKWNNQVDNINPLSTEFHTKRMLLYDVVSPVNKLLSRKRFIDCEIIGPANILLFKDNDIRDVTFHDCDFAVVAPNASIYNVVAFDRVTVLGGTIAKCVIFVLEGDMRHFEAMGVSFITPVTASKD